MREPCLADLALVGLFPRVGAVVLGEGGAVGKPFAAHVTLVGPIAGMGPHVGGDR